MDEIKIQCRDCKTYFEINITLDQYRLWCTDYITMRDLGLTENEKSLMITSRCEECTNRM